MIRKRGEIYYIRFKYAGKIFERSTGQGSRKVAEKIYRDTKAKLPRRRPGRPRKEFVPPPPPITFDDVCQMFFDSRTALGRSAKTLSWYRDKLSAWKPVLSGRTLEEITPAVIESRLMQRRKTVAASTVRANFRALSTLCRFAVKRGIIQANPLERMDQPKGKELRPAPIIPADLPGRVLRASKGSPFEDLVYLGIYAGLRISEAVKVTRAAFDFEAGWLRVAGKGGKERMIPIDGALRRHFENRETDGRYLSRWKYADDWSRRFARWARSRGFNFGAHYLRHIYASRMLKKHPITDVARWMGHSAIEVTYKIYSHYIPQDGEIERI